MQQADAVVRAPVEFVERDQESRRTDSLFSQGAQTLQVAVARRDALTSMAAVEPMRKSTSTPLCVRQ